MGESQTLMMGCWDGGWSEGSLGCIAEVPLSDGGPGSLGGGGQGRGGCGHCRGHLFQGLLLGLLQPAVLGGQVLEPRLALLAVLLVLPPHRLLLLCPAPAPHHFLGWGLEWGGGVRHAPHSPTHTSTDPPARPRTSLALRSFSSSTRTSWPRACCLSLTSCSLSRTARSLQGRGAAWGAAPSPARVSVGQGRRCLLKPQLPLPRAPGGRGLGRGPQALTGRPGPVSAPASGSTG